MDYTENKELKLRNFSTRKIFFSCNQAEHLTMGYYINTYLGCQVQYTPFSTNWRTEFHYKLIKCYSSITTCLYLIVLNSNTCAWTNYLFCLLFKFRNVNPISSYSVKLYYILLYVVVYLLSVRRRYIQYFRNISPIVVI